MGQGTKAPPTRFGASARVSSAMHGVACGMHVALVLMATHGLQIMVMGGAWLCGSCWFGVVWCDVYAVCVKAWQGCGASGCDLAGCSKAGSPRVCVC